MKTIKKLIGKAIRCMLEWELIGLSLEPEPELTDAEELARVERLVVGIIKRSNLDPKVFEGKIQN